MNQRFDIIGDIHGHHDKLVALLGRLGYARAASGATPSGRQSSWTI